MLRPLIVNAYRTCAKIEEVGIRIPPHSLVVEPLVDAAEELCLFQKKGLSVSVPVPHHVVKGNRFVIDLNKEVVKGYELFWNSSYWERGAVTIKLKYNAVDWSGILRWCQFVGASFSKHQILKVVPYGALAYADKGANDGFVVAVFSAANGIRELHLWVESGKTEELYSIAQASCRDFKLSSESTDDDQYIICDGEKYMSTC